MISSVIITITLFKQAEIAANLYFILLSLKGWLNKKKKQYGYFTLGREKLLVYNNNFLIFYRLNYSLINNNH